MAGIINYSEITVLEELVNYINSFNFYARKLKVQRYETESL